MNILLTSINFHPDHAGIAVYSTDLARYLAARGHGVAVVTSFPYYPQWKKRPADRAVGWRRESWEGCQVHRSYSFVPSRPTTLTRMLQDATFAVASIIGFLRAGRQEIVIVLSPPILLIAVALCFSRLWSAPLVVHIQDLQVDAALNLGMLRSGGLGRLLKWIEAFLYRRAELVVPISDGMATLVAGKGVSSSQMMTTYNWIDTTQHRDNPRAEFRAIHGIAQDRFVVAYAGNLGVKQGVDTLLDLAYRTMNDPAVHYLVIGDGADRARLVEYARSRSLSNVTFLPLLGESEYQGMLAEVDLMFLAQRAGAGEVFFPSKLLGILACGRPVLVAADESAEIARFVTRTRCGFVAPWGDSEGLAGHLQRVREDAGLLRQASEAGPVAIREFDREDLLGRLLLRLERLVER